MSTTGQGKVYTLTQRLKQRALEQKNKVIPETDDEEEVDKSVHSEDEESAQDDGSVNGSTAGEEEEEEEVKPKKSENKKREREKSSNRSVAKTSSNKSKKSKKPKPKEFLDSLTSGILNHVSVAAAEIESPAGSDAVLQTVLFNDVKDVDNANHIRRLIQCKTLLSSAMNFIQPYIEKIEHDMSEESKNYMKDMRTKFTNVCNYNKRLEEEKTKMSDLQVKKEE